MVTPKTNNAPLTLEGNYYFISNAASNTATLTFGGLIMPDAAAGAVTLSLGGPNTGANTIGGALADNGSSQLSLTITRGNWVLAGANSYTGATSGDRCGSG